MLPLCIACLELEFVRVYERKTSVFMCCTVTKNKKHKVCSTNFTGFCIKKAPCVGNPSKNFLLLWERELAAAQLNLAELVILEYVQKLFVLETKFNSKFSCYTVQEDWLLKTRNHFKKMKKNCV